MEDYLKSLSEFLALSLISRLVQKSKHILLVSLHTRLVERIHTEDVCRYATSLLEEVEELSEIVLVDFLHSHAKLRHAAVDVGEFGAQFSHSIAFLNVLACKEVEPVKILFVALDDDAA